MRGEERRKGRGKGKGRGEEDKVKCKEEKGEISSPMEFFFIFVCLFSYALFDSDSVSRISV